MVKDKIIKSSVFLLYILLGLSVLIIIKNPFDKFSSSPVIIKSKEEKYSSNEVFVEFDEDKVQKLTILLDGNEVDIENGTSLRLSDQLDGKKHRIIMMVEYKDGTKENFEEEYEIYSECDKYIEVKKEQTQCSNNCDSATKLLITKNIDKNTGKTCKQEQQEIACEKKECLIDNSEQHNQNTQDTTKESDNNKNNASSGLSDNNNVKNDSNNNINNNKNNTITDKEKDNQTKHACSLSVSKGSTGLNGWYTSDVTIKLNTGDKASKYGISNSTKATYNKKSSVTLTKETAKTTYYGYVKYSDGKTAKCEIVIKIDKTKPTVPTSKIRNGSATGEIINNTKSYRNYRVWWGEFKATDATSKIDHYEYSSKCSGSKSGNLQSSYLYPPSNSYSYQSYYCIRSVDKAGNVSNWSTANYFYVDLIKPTCLISRYGNTIKANGSDANSGVNSYSIDNGAYSSNNTKTITSGTKTTILVKDNAGNVGSCEYIDRIKTMILIGDSRTYHIQRRFSANNIIKPDVYEVEASKIYFVARSGGYYKWLNEGITNNCDKGEVCKVSAISQVNQLLKKLNNEKKYREVVILSNLGVNDINKYDETKSANVYITKYNKLMKSDWKPTTYLNTSFAFISVNPIDENLIKCRGDNNRTNKKIDTFNSVMQKTYGSKYFDSNSKLKEKSFGTKYDVRTNCKYGDGLHYNEETDKKIYSLYKSFVF